MGQKILWIDDEIDFLKPHILFLESKGYEVTKAISGNDALELLKEHPSGWDLVLLDENMPGLSGLETLERLKLVAPDVPVVMITKSEEEDLMDQAVGNQIRDYLIKPVNPNQILLTIKKLLDVDRLVSEQASVSYRREFMDISTLINETRTFRDWAEIYRRLTIKQLEFGETAPDIMALLFSQFEEAESAFFRFIKREYINLLAESSDSVLLSHQVMENKVLPVLRQEGRAVLMVMDNFRLDQWLTVKPLFTEHFSVENAELYCGLLPTATQYARNSLFSGLLPREIEKQFPDLWIDEEDERSKNLNEEPLVRNFLERNGLSDMPLSFFKANSSSHLNDVISSLNGESKGLTVIVINFVDILSHAKTDSEMIKELASNDAAYRSLTLSWFRHSPFQELLRIISRSGTRLFFTTDHGTILVKNPVKIVGDKTVNTALRYKMGRNLAYQAKEVMEISRPFDAGLPSPNLSTRYIFAGGHDFFVYQNNFNQYVRQFSDTYQHGGVSFEEMILPLIELKGKQ